MADPVLAFSIRGWQALSVYGDKRGLASAWAAADNANAHLPLGNRPLVVPDFDVREALGKKGTRSFDRHTGLFVASVGDALAEAALQPDDRMTAGIINGTATGSLSSIQDFLLDTWRLEKPYFVNPAHMPNTVINCAAGQCAIWHGIKGPNATVSAGAQSFAASVRLARRWATLGYASRFVVGAVEEVAPAVQALREVYARRYPQAEPLAEAAAAFVLEAVDPASASPDEDLVLAAEAGTAPDLSGRSVLESARQLLMKCGVKESEVARVSAKSRRGAAGHAAELAVSEAFGRSMASAGEVFGNTYSASGAMQLVLLLGLLRPGEHGLAVSASGNRSYSVLLLRKGGRT